MSLKGIIKFTTFIKPQ